MWFLLLIAISAEEYSAHSVYASLDECVASYTTENDICARVNLTIIELPAVPEIVTSKLEPEIPFAE